MDVRVEDYPKEFQGLVEKIKKGSVNYIPPIQEPKKTECLEVFNKYIDSKIFDSKGLSPLCVPTESTILLGNRRIGKTSLMKCWKESLYNSIQIVKFNRDNYVYDSGGWNANLYYQSLSNYTSRWIDEKEVRKFYRDIENLNEDYKSLSVTRYYFLDDFCYEKYLQGKNEFEKSFINYMDRLIRFLDNNPHIIVIAATNNKPHEFLDSEGMTKRVNEIFKSKRIL